MLVLLLALSLSLGVGLAACATNIGPYEVTLTPRPSDPQKIDFTATPTTSSGASPTIQGTLVPSQTPSDSCESEWFSDEFVITHYNYAMETDPAFYDSWPVWIKGNSNNSITGNLHLPNQHLYHFVYDLDKGVVKQGTGVTKDYGYITIDHSFTLSHYGIAKIDEVIVDDFFFLYGEGGAYAKSLPWQTVGVSKEETRLKPGDVVEIELYPGKMFTVTDTGTQLKDTGHLDVFVGPMYWQDVSLLGRTKSKVKKVSSRP